MAEGTALDALIAEMLGDIGELHEVVSSLRNILPQQAEQASARMRSQTDESVERLTRALGRILQVSESLKPNIDEFANKTRDKVLADILKGGADARTHLANDIGEQVLAIAGETARAKRDLAIEGARLKAEIVNTMSNQLNSYLDRQNNSNKSNLVKVLPILLGTTILAAIVGGASGVGSSKLFFEPPAGNHAVQGTLELAWPNLNTNSKRVIIRTLEAAKR